MASAAADDLTLALLAISGGEGVIAEAQEDSDALRLAAGDGDGAEADLLLLGCATFKACVFANPDVKALACRRGASRVVVEALGKASSNEHIVALCSAIRSLTTKCVPAKQEAVAGDAFVVLSGLLSKETELAVQEAAADAACAILTPPVPAALEAAREAGFVEAVTSAAAAASPPSSRLQFAVALCS